MWGRCLYSRQSCHLFRPDRQRRFKPADLLLAERLQQIVRFCFPRHPGIREHRRADILCQHFQPGRPVHRVAVDRESLPPFGADTARGDLACREADADLKARLAGAFQEIRGGIQCGPFGLADFQRCVEGGEQTVSVKLITTPSRFEIASAERARKAPRVAITSSGARPSA